MSKSFPSRIHDWLTDYRSRWRFESGNGAPSLKLLPEGISKAYGVYCCSPAFPINKRLRSRFSRNNRVTGGIEVRIDSRVWGVSDTARLLSSIVFGISSWRQYPVLVEFPCRAGCISPGLPSLPGYRRDDAMNGKTVCCFTVALR